MTETRDTQATLDSNALTNHGSALYDSSIDRVTRDTLGNKGSTFLGSGSVLYDSSIDRVSRDTLGTKGSTIPERGSLATTSTYDAPIDLVAHDTCDSAIDRLIRGSRYIQSLYNIDPAACPQ
jgi:hypothetical protein